MTYIGSMVIMKLLAAVLLLPFRLVALVVHASEEAHADAVAHARFFEE